MTVYDTYYKIYLTPENLIKIINVSACTENMYYGDRWLAKRNFNTIDDAIQFLKDCNLTKIDNPVVVNAIENYLKTSFTHILDKVGVNEFT